MISTILKNSVNKSNQITSQQLDQNISPQFKRFLPISVYSCLILSNVYHNENEPCGLTCDNRCPKQKDCVNLRDKQISALMTKTTNGTSGELWESLVSSFKTDDKFNVTFTSSYKCFCGMNL